MIPSGLDMAVDFAERGARVIYIVEHGLEIPGMLESARELAKDDATKYYRANGAQRIETAAGGKIFFFPPAGNGGRGVSANAVFAPPSVWANEQRVCDLIACINGSTFFGGQENAPLFSTLARIRVSPDVRRG